jgi:hypothetical protein
VNTKKRDLIQRSLRGLADSYAATMHLMEETLTLLCEELALDPLTYFRSRRPPADTDPDSEHSVTNVSLFTANFKGKACFLGNTLPFRFLALLAERPNAYVTYEDLLFEVWQSRRSDSAVRSVAKTLRNKLREAGMPDLADAIDGTVPGHYALKLGK